MATDKPFKTLFNGNDDRDKRLIKIFDKACKRFNIPNVLQDYMEHKIPASIPNMVLDTMNGILTFNGAKNTMSALVDFSPEISLFVCADLL